MVSSHQPSEDTLKTALTSVPLSATLTVPKIFTACLLPLRRPGFSSACAKFHQKNSESPRQETLLRISRLTIVRVLFFRKALNSDVKTSSTELILPFTSKYCSRSESWCFQYLPQSTSTTTESQKRRHSSIDVVALGEPPLNIFAGKRLKASLVRLAVARSTSKSKTIKGETIKRDRRHLFPSLVVSYRGEASGL